jgi:hypothetical protein
VVGCQLQSNLILLFLAFVFLSCASAPHRFDQENSGRWKARTLIKDTAKKKSHILYAEILAQKPQNLRVDVTTSLGVHLARVTLNESNLSYILTRDKKYFSGEPTAKALAPVLSMPLDPKLLVSILFDTEPTNGEWQCQKDKKDFLESCKSQDGVEVTWSDRQLERRTISVKVPSGLLQLELTGFQANVQSTPETFEIKVPPNFRQIRIRE